MNAPLVPAAPAPAPLLSVRNLRVEFRTPAGTITPVDDVSFDVAPGRVLSIVGESGSGKSVTALALLGLLDPTVGGVTGGELLFEGVDMRKLPKKALRDLRGSRIAMIFQEPMSALNPVMRIGEQVVESLVARGLPPRAARDRAIDLLDKVRIASPRQRADEYPHQLSGGMRQRAMIAMALAGEPKLLIADEPTTALDVTIQAQILDLLQRLREEMGMAMVLITHDLGVVAAHADDAVVMYCGRVVEQGPVTRLFARPSHPYTRGLLACVPKLGVVLPRMLAIGGTVPQPLDWQPGCRFAGRCDLATAECTVARPAIRTLGGGHAAACIRLGLESAA